MLLADADPSGQGTLGLRLTQCYSNFTVYRNKNNTEVSKWIAGCHLPSF